jgi:Ca-activated chloride channel family protein
MTFASPWVLALLILPIFLVWWETRHRGLPLILPFDHSPARSRNWLNRLVKCIQLSVPLLLATVIAILAGPQRLAQPEQERVLTNIEVVMDVSGSMGAVCGDGKRADGALRAVSEFTSFRDGDAFGLTIFGTDVVHWVPLTKDLSVIRLAAPFVRPEQMPPHMGGTRIGHAIDAVHTKMRRLEEGDRMIILISDGASSDLRGRAQQLGEDLAADNITLFYIHTAESEPQAETYTIASLTGGEAYTAGDPAALADVFRRIDEMKPTKVKPGAPEYVDYFDPFALAGLALLGIQLVGIMGVRFTPW